MKRLLDGMNREIMRCEGDSGKLEYDASKYSWTRRLVDFAEKGETVDYDETHVVPAMYRPFCRQYVYYDVKMNEMTYQQPRLFPFVGCEGEKAERTYQQPIISSRPEGKGGAEMTYQQASPLLPNLVITLTDGSNPSCLIADTLPDLHFVGDSQCFPLYWYEKAETEVRVGSAGDAQQSLFGALGSEQAALAETRVDYIRHDAITGEALAVFRAAYPHAFGAEQSAGVGCGAQSAVCPEGTSSPHSGAETRNSPVDCFAKAQDCLSDCIMSDVRRRTGLVTPSVQTCVRDSGGELTKEDVFYYVYGVLHSPEYRERFAANLKKELPRIPLAEDFRAFSEAGRALAVLHLGYETAEPYPLTVRGDAGNPGRVTKMKWGKRRDPESGKKVDDRTTLVYNENLAYTGIPEAANDYKVNGRSPLEWMMDRYQVKTDKASGIVNDPNDYSDDPTYIAGLIPRLVTVSMETLAIVNSLPPLNENPQPANWPFAWKASEG